MQKRKRYLFLLARFTLFLSYGGNGDYHSSET